MNDVTNTPSCEKCKANQYPVSYRGIRLVAKGRVSIFPIYHKTLNIIFD